LVTIDALGLHAKISISRYRKPTEIAIEQVRGYVFYRPAFGYGWQVPFFWGQGAQQGQQFPLQYGEKVEGLGVHGNSVYGNIAEG
jgi:hypothetical protein